LEVPEWIQCSLSHNRLKGTVRGLHYQADPHGETKLVRCTRGAVWDVVVDVRDSSPTRFQWVALELNELAGAQLLIPPGFAHGFQTLSDSAEVSYFISTRYVADAARGLRWNDPRLGIDWPAPPTAISDRDAAFPLIEA
jgi:dTDP-4-dehydrorhamnose 3,5-epimerase